MSRAMQFDIVANDKATGSMKNVEKSMDGFTQRIGNNFTKMAMKAAAVYAAVTKITQVFKQGADIADEAARLGVDVELYQRLAKAADRYGSNVDELAKSLKEVNKLLDDAARKQSGPQMDALRALGFSDDQIINREIKRIEVLERLGEAIANARSEEEEFAMASQILGDKTTMALIPILKDMDGFKKVMASTVTLTKAEAEALGRTEDAINDVVDAGKALFLKGLANAADLAAGQNLEGEIGGDTARTPSEKSADSARRLLALGAKPEATKVEKTGGLAVTSLQEIGGGIARGPSALENYAARTAVATETMAGQLRSTPPPATSSTDITKPSIPGRVIASVGDVLKGGLPKAPPAPASDPFTTSRMGGLKRTF